MDIHPTCTMYIGHSSDIAVGMKFRRTEIAKDQNNIAETKFKMLKDDI